MSQKKTAYDASGVTEVGCHVQHCVYQEQGHCHADRISVQNKTAECKGETFCDTFAPRAEN